MKLSTKVTISLTVGSLLLVGTLSFGIFVFTKSILTDSVGESQLNLASKTLDAIDRFLYEEHLNIQILAASPFFERYLAGSQRDANATRDVLHKYAPLTGPWDSLFLVKTNGDIALSLFKEKEGKTVATEVPLMHAHQMALDGRVYYSDAQIVDGTVTIIFSAPVRDESKRGNPVVGSIIGLLSWPTVEEVLQQIPLNAYMVNAAGGVIASNRIFETGISDTLLFNVEDFRQIHAALGGEDGFTIHTLDFDKEVLVASATEKGFLDYVGFGWSIIVSQPTKTAFAPAITFAFEASLLFGGVTAIVIAFLIFFFRNSFVRPLEELSKSAADIVSGDRTSLRVSTEARDEIGALARSFDHLVRFLLKESDFRKQIIDVLPNALLVVDMQGTIRNANVAAEKLLDFDTGMLVEKQLENSILPEEDTDVSVSEALGFDSLIKENILQDYKVAVRTVKGRKLYIAISGRTFQPFRTEELALLVLTDQTEQEKLDADKRAFLAIASHQLRTPLSGTKWLIETMRRGVVGTLSKKQEEYLVQIYQINERMIKLVSDMLSTLRLEGGAESVKKEPLSLQELCAEVTETIGPAARTRNISLRNEMSKDAKILLHSDKQMLKNILASLLSNAINFSSPGQEVVLNAKEESGGVILSVRDSGIGIPRSEQNKIFERFYRATNAKTFKPEGTGLGLYIASLLAEKLDAKIWFESEEGKGTTFYVRLPQKQ